MKAQVRIRVSLTSACWILDLKGKPPSLFSIYSDHGFPSPHLFPHPPHLCTSWAPWLLSLSLEDKQAKPKQSKARNKPSKPKTNKEQKKKIKEKHIQTNKTQNQESWCSSRRTVAHVQFRYWLCFLSEKRTSGTDSLNASNAQWSLLRLSSPFWTTLKVTDGKPCLPEKKHRNKRE